MSNIDWNLPANWHAVPAPGVTALGMLAALAVFSVLALTASFLTARALRRLRARNDSLESSLAAVRREMELVASIGMRAGRRVKRIERDHVNLVDRLGVLELRCEARPYDQAIALARRGADSGKLAEQLGLSRGEADLVSRLHGRKKSA
jgi:type II secretory pathway component PulJ